MTRILVGVLMLMGLAGCASGVGGEPIVPDDTTKMGGDDDGDSDSSPPGGDDSAPPGGDDGGGGPPPIFIDPYSSLLVVDHVAFARVEEEFTMGKLMLDVAAFIHEQTLLWNANNVRQRPLHDTLEFALHPFTGGSRDTEKHNAHDGVKHGVTPVIFDSNNFMILNPEGEKKWNPIEEPRGPFRLLAVVNRIDLAGDHDTRGGGQFAGIERRWFGEGRLVFGLTRDREDGPYPMTFIAEYRLPALKKNPDGTVVVDTSFDFVAGPASNDAWKEGRKLWADLWRELSDYDRHSDAYQQKLRDIVALFAIGDYSLGVRSGERVQTPDRVITDEFEYREHYLNGAWMLANRKVRREPFRCAEMSEALRWRLEEEWNEEANWFHYDYRLADRSLFPDEVDEIAALCGGELPFGQGEEGDDDDKKKSDYQLRAKFVRFTPSDVWTTLLGEAQRHAFAMGTCTGCHGAETATHGFIIAPRLANEDAKLAPFMTGSRFTNNGVTYEYDELGRRRALLERFIRLEEVPVEMLTLFHE